MPNKNIVYVGLDIDKTVLHGAGIIRETASLYSGFGEKNATFRD